MVRRIRLGPRTAAGLALSLGITAIALAPAFVDARDDGGRPATPNQSVDPHVAAAAETAAHEIVAECRVSEPLPPAAVVMDRIVTQLQAEQEQGLAGAGELVVLNGRGYNYGPPPGVGIDPMLPRGDRRRDLPPR
jgi:hypothetical protein